MPTAKFSITGDVEDFERIDNVYRSLKREGGKLLKNWVIDLNVTYEEKQGEKPL